jgi:hypothetical protein
MLVLVNETSIKVEIVANGIFTEKLGLKPRRSTTAFY